MARWRENSSHTVMIRQFRLLLLLLLCGWGFPAAASPYPSGVIEPLALEHGLEPELRAAGRNCAYAEWCCQCLVSVRADLIAAPERRDPSSDAAPAACPDVQPSAFIPVSGVAAMFAALATAPGPNRPLYLLHLSLRR